LSGRAKGKDRRAMEQLAPDFWTVRGDFRIAGVINVGTQMSLVRRKSGRFVLLDSYEPDAAELRAIEDLTEGGRRIEAIINVHPFHTLHCGAIHRRFPHAELIGTERHRRKDPGLPWSEGLIEEQGTQDRFAQDFEFSIPEGVDFVCQDETVHVGSVLVRHRESRIVHVDDTLNVFAAPGLLKPFFPAPRLRFHPMLGKALEKRPGAADDYEGWARALADAWADTLVVCAAHSQVHRLASGGFRNEVLAALRAVDGKLASHRLRFG
jgi:hypothetical protein